MTAEKLIEILKTFDPKTEIFYLNDTFPTEVDSVKMYMVKNIKNGEVMESSSIQIFDPNSCIPVITLE